MPSKSSLPSDLPLRTHLNMPFLPRLPSQLFSFPTNSFIVASPEITPLDTINLWISFDNQYIVLTVLDCHLILHQDLIRISGLDRPCFPQKQDFTHWAPALFSLLCVFREYPWLLGPLAVAFRWICLSGEGLLDPKSSPELLDHHS